LASTASGQGVSDSSISNPEGRILTTEPLFRDHLSDKEGRPGKSRQNLAIGACKQPPHLEREPGNGKRIEETTTG